MTNAHKLATAVLGALLLIALLMTTAGAQTGGARQFADWLIAQRLTVNNAAIFNGSVTAGDDLAVAGDLDVVGALDVTGAAILRSSSSAEGTFTINGSDLVIAHTLAIAPQTAISVTDGGIITPIGTIQLLEAAGDVTATLASGGAGDVVTLINTADLTITVEDTTGQILASDATLGQWDTLTVIWYGTSWIELDRSNN